MKLIASSTTIAVLQIASHVHAEKSSVVTSVDLAYNAIVKKHSLRKQMLDLYETHLLNQECTFPSDVEETTADSGILRCDTGSICVEDTLSSAGGRCVSAVDNEEHELQTCTKCTGKNACQGLTESFKSSFIGCGSCNGNSACAHAFNITIGQDSCNGRYACYYLVNATIGDRSCTGNSAKGITGYYGYECVYLQGVVGNDSCQEYLACYQAPYAHNKVVIGNGSCRGDSSCMYFGNISFGNGSCNAPFACYSNTANIGSHSCNAAKTCSHNSAALGDCLCGEAGQCQNNTESKDFNNCTMRKNPTQRPTMTSSTQRPITALSTVYPITSAPTNGPTQ